MVRDFNYWRAAGDYKYWKQGIIWIIDLTKTQRIMEEMRTTNVTETNKKKNMGI